MRNIDEYLDIIKNAIINIEKYINSSSEYLKRIELRQIKMDLENCLFLLKNEDFENVENKLHEIQNKLKDMKINISLLSFSSVNNEEINKNNVSNNSVNPYGLDFNDLDEDEILKQSIDADIPVFLHGEAGCGKSARVKSIDPDCEIIYLRQASPESLNGKSINSNGEMKDIPPTWYTKLCEKCRNEPDKIHILFFDEITNALPSIQGMAFNIVLDREVNGKWKLPENVRVVAAGNEEKDSLSANKLSAPLFGRFAHVYIKTELDKWLLWASRHDIHPAVYAYIAYRKGDILRTPYNGETPNADPRKWEMVSKMLKKNGNPKALRAFIGEDLATEFVAFCSQKVITLEQVLNDRYTEQDLKLDTSQQYATVVGLSAVKEKDFIKVRKFVQNMNPELCKVFDGMWAHGDKERLDIIQEARMEMQNNIRKVG